MIIKRGEETPSNYWYLWVAFPFVIAAAIIIGVILK